MDSTAAVAVTTSQRRHCFNVISDHFSAHVEVYGSLSLERAFNRFNANKKQRKNEKTSCASLSFCFLDAGIERKNSDFSGD